MLVLKLIWKIVCIWVETIYLYSWYLLSTIGDKKRKAKYDAYRATLTQEERDKADAEAKIYFDKIVKEMNDAAVAKKEGR